MGSTLCVVIAEIVRQEIERKLFIQDTHLVFGSTMLTTLYLYSSYDIISVFLIRHYICIPNTTLYLYS